ncbi:hypothetical protein [Priestia flexa]|uniref:hypothetical protein n=1 Tax=Priestia flexa TaxID=86664 RepID=UPI0032ECFC56
MYYNQKQVYPHPHPHYYQQPVMKKAVQYPSKPVQKPMPKQGGCGCGSKLPKR